MSSSSLINPTPGIGLALLVPIPKLQCQPHPARDGDSMFFRSRPRKPTPYPMKYKPTHLQNKLKSQRLSQSLSHLVQSSK